MNYVKSSEYTDRSGNVTTVGISLDCPTNYVGVGGSGTALWQETNLPSPWGYYWYSPVVTLPYLPCNHYYDYNRIQKLEDRVRKLEVKLRKFTIDDEIKEMEEKLKAMKEEKKNLAKR
jgi:hypothetical protein